MQEKDKKLLIAIFISIGFGIGMAIIMVPLYRTLCSSYSVGNIATRDIYRGSEVDKRRTVRIEFDSNISKLEWSFQAMQSSILVHPGEIATVYYKVLNNTDKSVTGQAIPSISPGYASRYFYKLECFCFKPQTMKPKEERIMKVRFILAPGVSSLAKVVTLSYTFFPL